MHKSAITKEQKLRLVTSLVASVVCLCCLISLTLAWFADNRRADASGLTVGIRKDDGIVVATGYYNIVTSDSVGKYTFTAATDTSPAALGKYSLTDDRYQMLMKLYIVDSVTEITVRVVTDTTYFLGNEGYPLLATKEYDEKGTYRNVLSSCISISALEEGKIAENDDGTLYLSALPSSDRTATLIDISDGVGTVKTDGAAVKQTADSETITLSAGTETVGTVSCRTVYLLISYDSLLMSTIFSRNISNTNLEDEKGNPIDVPFVCDFSLEISTVTD